MISVAIKLLDFILFLQSIYVGYNTWWSAI